MSNHVRANVGLNTHDAIGIGASRVETQLEATSNGIGTANEFGDCAAIAGKLAVRREESRIDAFHHGHVANILAPSLGKSR